MKPYEALCEKQTWDQMHKHRQYLKNVSGYIRNISSLKGGNLIGNYFDLLVGIQVITSLNALIFFFFINFFM